MSVREIRLTNTLTKQKEVFRPQDPSNVKFYTCGPTTYGFIHVGNGRTALGADLIYRTLKLFGYGVTYVRNYTDVDDKIIETAKEQGIAPAEHAKKYVEICRQDYESVGMLAPTHSPKVTETMPEIIAMVGELVKKGAAYVVDGEVLYDVSKKSDYLKLSHKKMDDLLHGHRVSVEKHKKNPADFVLWKPAKPGEPSWESPWGKGRPGWHIECSAMAKKFLGDTIDLHHGAVDLIFPHHENEIAQSEAANGCTFCGTWIHNEFLNMNNEKMSKSLGNVVTVRSFVEKYGGVVLRQIYLSAHYKSVFLWSDESVERALNDVERLYEFWRDFQNVPRHNRPGQYDVAGITAVKEKMFEELANDFNAPGALGQLFSMIRDVRRDYLNKNEIPEVLAKEILTVIEVAQKGLGLWEKPAEQVLSDLQRLRGQRQGTGAMKGEDVEKLIEERKQAKAQKNWARSDEIRKDLKAKGIVLKDNPDGSTTFSYE